MMISSICFFLVQMSQMKQQPPQQQQQQPQLDPSINEECNHPVYYDRPFKSHGPIASGKSDSTGEPIEQVYRKLTPGQRIPFFVRPSSSSSSSSTNNYSIGSIMESRSQRMLQQQQQQASPSIAQRLSSGEEGDCKQFDRNTFLAVSPHCDCFQVYDLRILVQYRCIANSCVNIVQDSITPSTIGWNETFDTLNKFLTPYTKLNSCLVADLEENDN